MCTTLIVEDSAVFRRALKDVLQARFASMYVAEARNGEEALEIIDSLLPDIIILELVLPEGIGLHITKSLKTRLPNTVIVTLIDYDVPEYQQAAFAFGANYVLSKNSCSAADIVAVVDRAVSAKYSD